MSVSVSTGGVASVFMCVYVSLRKESKVFVPVIFIERDLVSLNVTSKEVGVASLYANPAKGGVVFVPIGFSEGEKEAWTLLFPVNEGRRCDLCTSQSLPVKEVWPLYPSTAGVASKCF